MCKNMEGSVAYYADDAYIYAQKGSETFRLALFENGFYRLRLWNGIPILEIDGVRMHLVKDFKSPLDYSKSVVRRLRLASEDRVLDTCMGLGYTAIAAGKAASHVTTCEYSDAVYTLASWNPFSEALFSDKAKFNIMRGDISVRIRECEDNSFDAIIHDPPRFSKAGNLYSEEFYRELRRVLSKGGRLYHYVGSVGRGKGRNIEKEVAGRLKSAGFIRMSFDRKLQGIIAFTP